MTHLSLSFFNSFDVHAQGHALTNFRSDKTRGLLIYLVLEAETVHTRTELATLLWPEESAETSRHNLRQALYQLRRTLGDKDSSGNAWLLITRQTLQFNRTADYTLDVQQFSDALDSGNLESVETRYTGQLLPTFTCDSRPFEEWLDRKRQAYQQAALNALHDLAEQQLTIGDSAIGWAQALARRQLDLEPWREEAHGQLMRALAMAGDRTAAIAQFDICTDVLARELGVSPAPKTFALFEAIRDGRALTVGQPNAPPIANNLPHQSTPLLGRSAEIDQLTTYLHDPTTHLITLIGAGGIGKTRLILHVAHQQLASHNPLTADGIFFVPLATLTDAEEIPEAIAAAVGFRWQGKLEQLINFLAPKQLLLILDNLEHMQGDSQPLISTLLHRLPHLHLCITSRERLNRHDERAILLQGLPIVEADILNSPAAQLFLAAARGNVVEWIAEQDCVVAIGRICHLTEGMPLALVLAAAWTDILHPVEVASKIERDLNFLAGEIHDLPARQRSMRATFAYTWSMLTEPERRAFANLSVFRGGFSRHAAQQVANLKLPILAQLVRKSLVVYDAAAQRYAIHELLRQFGADYLTTGWERQPPSADTIRTTHSRYYLTAVSERVAHMLGRNQSGAFRDIATDYANVQSAWRWATTTEDVALLSNTLQGMYYFHLFTGRELEGIAQFEQTAALFGGMETQNDEHVHLQAQLRTRSYSLQPTIDSDSLSAVTRLRDHFLALQDKYEYALTLKPLAAVAIQQRDVIGAMQIYTTQLASFEQCGAAFEQALCLTDIMRLCILSGQIERGLQAGRAAAQLFEERNDRLGMSVVNVVLGAYHMLWRGEYRVAKQHFRQTVQVGEEMAETGHVITGVVLAHLFLGMLCLLDGDVEQAQTFANAARPLAERKNTAYAKAALLGLDALIALTQGKDEQAFALSSQGLGLSQEPGSVEMNLLANAYAACRLNHLKQAHTIVHQQAISIVQLQRQPTRSYLLLFVPVIACLNAEKGNYYQASKLLTSARSHPACPRHWWDKMTLIQQMEARLQTALSPDEFAMAQTAGLEMDVGGLAEAIIQDLNALA